MYTSRVILVTGANKGIGYEAVKSLSQQLPDATILLTSRSADNGKAAVKKMQESVPGHSFQNVEVIQLDITQQTSLDAAVETVRSKYGKVTDLVHNSGVSNVDDGDNYGAVFEVNLRGARNTIEAFAPLVPAKAGRIVLVSSQVGAWYTQACSPETRAKLEDVNRNDWTQVEKDMYDFVSFSQGKDTSIQWPVPSGIDTQSYGCSKALVTAWGRNYAITHPDIPFAIVCPGWCSTELGGEAAPRSAAQGAKSVIWPLFNDFDTGILYQDGKKFPFAVQMPQW